MRFLFLTPGTGHFYCGSCLRDHSLASALRHAGHDVTVVPLYLPLMLEEPTAEERDATVHMGGINMFLQQKASFASRLPRFLANLLDRPGLLRFVARRGNMTDSSGLGAMTLSMLQGEDGRQKAEVDKLVEWARTEPPPDVIAISNLLLTGVVRRLKEALGRPVVATVQGEQPFLDALPEPYRSDAWRELATRARDIDAIVPVSHSYEATIKDRLDFTGQSHMIHNGLDLAHFVAEPPRLADRTPPTVGYLARMCRDKGLHTLVESFIELRRRAVVPDLRLAICGVMLAEDRPFVAEQKRRLDAAGLNASASFHPNLERDEKLAKLRSFSVLSVPATYGESFGLYVLEALASGVPVAQPEHGAFPELIEATGGGRLCTPDDPGALADELAALLTDQSTAQQLADAGRLAVREHFQADRMAAEFAALCTEL